MKNIERIQLAAIVKYHFTPDCLPQDWRVLFTIPHGLSSQAKFEAVRNGQSYAIEKVQEIFSQSASQIEITHVVVDFSSMRKVTYSDDIVQDKREVVIGVKDE